jgi:hypothetical protein
MGVLQSNLSDPHYGFDLVVAVTQVSVNATLKQLLAGLSAPEVIVCYVYDSENNLVPIDYRTLMANANGSDPFRVPDKANPATDPDLTHLAAANFAGAVRARIGLPDLPLANLPPIAILGSGSNAPVQFNLLCSEFQITGFQYGPRGSATWLNRSQPTSGTPWYFSSNVSLNTSTVDPASPVPPAVQQRIIELQHQVRNAFTIQKLFLDLDTAILTAVPTLGGIVEGLDVWNLISKVFLNAYFKQLRQRGDPVLSYSFTLHAPRPTTLDLGSVSRECLPPMGSGANPTSAQRDATALVYIGSQSTTAPIPVPFGWDWIDAGDVHAYSGVQAVRRDVFFAYFAKLLNADVAPLCIKTEITMTHSGQNFEVRLATDQSNSPASFGPISPLQAPDGDGFVDMLTVDFPSNSSAGEWSDGRFVQIWGEYNYNMTGRVAVKGNQIRIRVTSKGHIRFGHGELLVNYEDLPGKDYYNKTLTVIYTLAVDQFGALQVTETHSVAEASAPWAFNARGILGGLGYENGMKDALTKLQGLLTGRIDSAFTSYVREMTATINGYRAWVFPGNDAFTFKSLAFSSAQDLTAKLTYANPN